MAASIVYSSPKAWVNAAKEAGMATDELPELWEQCDSAAASITYARQKVQRVAKKHGHQEARAPRAPTLTEETVQSALAKVATRRRRCKAEVVDAEAAAQEDLDNMVLAALALIDEVGEDTPRMQRFEKRLVAQEERVRILTDLILQRATVAETIKAHVTNITKLKEWAVMRQECFNDLDEFQINKFLYDQGRGKTTPRAILNSLMWFKDILQVQWPLDDPLVKATATRSSKQAARHRQQAQPYTYEIVTVLLTVMMTATGAMGFAIGFLLILALGCLRYSDLNRTKGMTLGRDSLYGTTWRSKKAPRPVPWAAIRYDWEGKDWGQRAWSLITELLPAETKEYPRGWTWPWMILQGNELRVGQPIQQGTYGNCLNVMQWIHQRLKLAQGYTLHSPRFYLPSLAGQAGLPLELRRSLGHWGPNSLMPIRYDQARCATELAAKKVLWQTLAGGFTPSGDFEVPDIENCRQTWQKFQKPEEKKGGVPVEKSAAEASAKPLVCTDQYLLNMKSMMAHKLQPGNTRQTLCPYVRKAEAAHYKWWPAADGVPKAFIQCATCWSKEEDPEKHKKGIPAWAPQDATSSATPTNSLSVSSASSEGELDISKEQEAEVARALD